MRIFIDPGHGGSSDSGAFANGIKEKDINLTVALELKRLLMQCNNVETRLSRNLDITVSLQARAKLSDDWGADYFISIHHNAFNGTADGYEIIHSIFYGKGAKLADIIGKEFNKLGQNCRRIFSKEGAENKDYYYVIRVPKATSIITEYAFIDNAQDVKAVDTDVELKGEAMAIYNALKQFCNLRENEDVALEDAIYKWYKAGKIGDPHGMKNDFDTNNLKSFRFKAFLIKSAETLKGVD